MAVAGGAIVAVLLIVGSGKEVAVGGVATLPGVVVAWGRGNTSGWVVGVGVAGSKAITKGPSAELPPLPVGVICSCATSVAA